MTARFPIAIALAMIATSASAGPAAAGSETGIPYASSDGIIDWKVVGRSSLYLLSARGDWYLARTTAPCPRMLTAMALGFDTAGTDRLDRFGAIVAEGRRCPIASLVRAPEPPAGWHQRKRGRRS
ncbi:MAG: hypothetical protein JWP15_3384 [Alphaproteobacteria bacterium]|nr:hypothetical protein [Alphaproteobacteria bacterium]